MRVNRRAFVTAIAGVAASSLIARKPAFAAAAEFRLKLATELAPDHPLNVYLIAASDQIRRETDGRVDLQVFPNNQLGGGTDMLSQVRNGALEFFCTASSVLSSLVPIVALNSMAFAFKDLSQVFEAMDGALGDLLRERISKQSGLLAQPKIFDSGFRQVTTSTKPVLTVADVQGMKIRVPVSPLYTSMWRSLGSLPAAINFAEVYSALQTRVVDAQENPLALIQTSKFYEVQKYCSLTNHMWDGQWLLSNRRAWDKLPDDIKQVLEKTFAAAAVSQREAVAKLNGSLKESLEQQGLMFNSVDPSSFRAKLQESGFYKEWRGKYGDDAWAVLEKYSGPLS